MAKYTGRNDFNKCDEDEDGFLYFEHGKKIAFEYEENGQKFKDQIEVTFPDALLKEKSLEVQSTRNNYCDPEESAVDAGDDSLLNTIFASP